MAKISLNHLEQGPEQTLTDINTGFKSLIK